MRQIAEVIHTARIRTTGGREHGTSRSPDGVLDLRFAEPGSARTGTTPEHLFAAAWSASFESALMQAAHARRLALSAGVVIETEVDLCRENDGTHFLQVRLGVGLPSLARDVARALVDEAHSTCPYSEATRRHIDVTIDLV